MQSILTPRYTASPVSKPKIIKFIPYTIKNSSSLGQFPILKVFLIILNI
ncbi:hypothetical protein DDB_G0279625 [Dictyostelium discoideum AX4]|uniref:Uncharacterized protein n=1 Tax=Dictyostelium discoideum TaxID=44689 RepID=Q54WJ2_DICDI|nr:hypothetical protein DDB_G0279625 [Dictyostelium discoideum AX4]EAL67587.1 hypothetical protein DDB_G0279625 [Dictyostelium discoideum AX4]|eukprot:XP_641561.1 hypothetical protein DDB_G0279625 [Dictyostelium discoideum AX4]